TPAKSQAAYAGPTFHASPAPSALPLPKFFSKSVPSTTSQPSFQSRLDGESDSSSSSPSPPPAAVPEPPRHEESPLDIFFRADREEKAKLSGGFFTPKGKADEAMPNVGAAATVPTKSADRRHHSRHSSNGSGKGFFMMELDGDNVNSRPPATITPVSGRSVTAPSKPPQSDNVTNQESETQALKDLLFSLASPKPHPPTPYAGLERGPSEPSSRFQTPSPFYQPKSVIRSTSGPTTPAPSNDASLPSLHYGNRNLSPLFKAAKTDSIKRASNLRTELKPSSPT
ncbi:hypothetical protein K432DRAFT_247744, partial [Lepidopterella palustris CBS 459.81]